MGVSAARDGCLERMGTPVRRIEERRQAWPQYQAADRGRMPRWSHCTVINGPVIAPAAAKECQRQGEPSQQTGRSVSGSVAKYY